MVWLKSLQHCLHPLVYMPALVAQLDTHLTGDQEVAGSTRIRLASFFS